MPNFSLDRRLYLGKVSVAAAEANLPNVIGFGDYGPVDGKPIGIYATTAVTGTIVVKVYSGATDAAGDLVQTSRAYTAAEINSGNVKVYVPKLADAAKYLKVSVTGSTAAGACEAYLESYAGK
jgi:hypothetical protein